MSDLPIGLPIDISAKVGLSYTKSVNRFEIDSNIFPPCYSNIKQVGRVKPRTFHIKCDGKGHMDFREILTIDKQMKRLNKWHKKGQISDKDYEEKKAKILEDL